MILFPDMEQNSGNGRTGGGLNAPAVVPVTSNRHMKIKRAYTLGAALLFASLTAAPLQAKLAWKKKAAEFDPAANSCRACHTKDKPKKNDPLSERGQWLVDQKTERQAKEIDLSWLRDYPKNGQDTSSPKN